MAKILKLGENPVFGIEQTCNTGAFLVDSFTFDAQPKSVEITNGLGQKSGEVIYDQTLTYSYTGTLKDGITGSGVKVGASDYFAQTFFNGQGLSALASDDLPNCGGIAIIKTISTAYNAGQVAKITVTGEYNMPEKV